MHFTRPASIVVMADAFYMASVDCCNGKCNFTWPASILFYMADAFYIGQRRWQIHFTWPAMVVLADGKCIFHWPAPMAMHFTWQLYFAWPAPMAPMADAFYMASVDCSTGKCILHGWRPLF